jgi:hypothetical protein
MIRARFAVLLATAGLAATALAGCSASVSVGPTSVSAADLTKTAGDLVQKSAGSNFAEGDVMDCPTDLDLTVGATEVCTLTLADGTAGSFDATITAVDGSNYTLDIKPVS